MSDLKVKPHPKLFEEAFSDSEIEHYPNYYEDDLHPDWVFKISRTYDPKLLHHWSESNRTLYKSDRWTQGENGSAFIPIDDDEKEMVSKSREEHNYSLYASEHMSLHRSLPDLRYDECRKLTYPDRLPTVSIIIIFHNEGWSMILRTIWSIIDRSPPELLHEIILVDDVSTWDFLKRPLDDYIELLPVNIRIIRTKQREGLIRARLIGAAEAKVNIPREPTTCNHFNTFISLNFYFDREVFYYFSMHIWSASKVG